MKRFLCLLLLLGLSGPAFAQAPIITGKVTTKDGKTYHKGRVAPKNLQALHEMSDRLHGERIRKLPKATEPSWDSRKLGFIPPVLDQGQCLPAGVFIAMADGSQKPVEFIKPGDYVITADNNSIGKVTEVYTRQVKEDLVTIKTGHDDSVYEVSMTTNHPVLTETGYVEAGNIKAFDRVRQLDRKFHSIEIGKCHYKGTVYNFKVAGDHSYFANGIAVHNCGSCWDFSGTFCVTAALIKAGYGPADGTFACSEQYTLDCGQNGGCNGDDNTTVLIWAQKTGLPLTSTYGPYQAQAGRCNSSPGKLYKIKNWGYAGSQNLTATQDIKNAIKAYGFVGCAIAADNAFSNTQPGTVFLGSGSTQIDHDVAIVGWDDSKGPNGAYLLRNSWGTSWCDEGYCWIAYGANLVGTEAVWCEVDPIAALPVITSPTSDGATVGVPYSYQIVASGSPTSFAASGLPSSLTCSATGLISGTPTLPGALTITLSAGNAVGVATATLALTVASGPTPPPIPPTPPTPPAGAPVITSPLTSAGVVGTSYSYQIAATNSPAIYGAIGLPAGLTCSATGLVSGTPTVTGSSTILIFAGNQAGITTASLELSVTNTPAEPVIIMLTPDQIQSVISQAKDEVVIRDLQNRLLRAKQKEAPKEVPASKPCCGQKTAQELKIESLEQKIEQSNQELRRSNESIQELRRSNEAIMKALLPAAQTRGEIYRENTTQPVIDLFRFSGFGARSDRTHATA